MYKTNANKWNILVIFCKTHIWDQQNIKHPDPRLQKKIYCHLIINPKFRESLSEIL